MQCPRCKNDIEDNSLKCSFCGAKVASVCKDCGTINSITSKTCAGCNKVLIRICEDCGAANRPEAKTCRKCGRSFIKQQITQPEYIAEKYSQQKAKAILIDSIKDSDKKIISINGESGIGKNLILKTAIEELKNAKLIWLLGSCTQITQLSPFGFFQDLLLSFFNINNFCPDTLQLKKNSINFFKQDFPTLSNTEILDLLNFLYPEKLDKFENLYYNKAKTFTMMKKVMLTIVEKMKTIFIIDNFEYIDSMSFDFIEELLQDDYILERCKFIVISSTEQPGLGRFNSNKLNTENYTDISLALFSQSQANLLLKQCLDINFEKEISEKIYKISKGNPGIIEQTVMMYKDFNKYKIKEMTWNSFDDVIKNRIDILKNNNITGYRMLIAMSILGNKFYPAMLENFDSNTNQDFEKIMRDLIQLNFVTAINNLAFEFKCNKMWEIIVSIVKNDNIFEEILILLQNSISIYKQSSIALLGYIVQKLNSENEAFSIWTILMKQASYIGDIGLYVITQKQALKLIENKNSPNYYKIKKNIYTRLGKILEPIDYESSFDYLQKAIMMLDDEDNIEYIELLGYLASSAMKKGNYWGVIECTETVFSKLPDNLELEKTLVKSKQIRPLLRLGNYGQVVNLLDTEILQVVEKYINKNKNTTIITIEELYNLWIELYFDYAEALTFQGDSKAFEISKIIFDIIEKNKTKDPQILCKAYLTLALANTIKGDIKTSSNILDDILKEFTLETMNSYIISRWNFIDILNKFIAKDYDNLYLELFNVVAFANNINDNFTKNILKTLLAQILKDKNENKKTLEILEEQISYFAKEKIATGVLLSWYLIAKTRLITNGTQFALDIATKALDIAQSSSINNYFFISLFNKLIGEIYMAKQDFESAKIYIEKSIYIAKQFNIEIILVKSYILYAKFYQELALPKSTLRGNYIKQALKNFQNAQNVQIVQDQKFLQKTIKQELSILTSFCRLNGITLKRSSK